MVYRVYIYIYLLTSTHCLELVHIVYVKLLAATVCVCLYEIRITQIILATSNFLNKTSRKYWIQKLISVYSFQCSYFIFAAVYPLTCTSVSNETISTSKANSNNCKKSNSRHQKKEVIVFRT